jgi:hypothetical protein
MSYMTVLVDEIIDDLCGNEYRQGYGLDEWSGPIQRLKLLRTKIAALDIKEGPALHTTAAAQNTADTVE